MSVPRDAARLGAGRHGRRRRAPRGSGAATARRRRPPRRRRRPPRPSRAGRSRAARRRRASGDRVAAALARIAGRLELDRRLALVVDRARGSRRAPRPRRTGGPCSSSAARRAPVCDEPGTCAQARAIDAPGQRRAGARRLAAGGGDSHAHAIRHGSRIARSPPGQPHRQQRADAVERREVADEQLAAPDRAVEAVAGAVEDRADRRPWLAVLGQARRQVGVVVLDADQLDALALERVLGREVLGVQVVRDDLRARPRTAARSARSPR